LLVPLIGRVHLWLDIRVKDERKTHVFR
jgi:hypothetical protein